MFLHQGNSYTLEQLIELIKQTKVDENEYISSI